jgi:predicted TIM-barrel fold metal-dependent hydrolase
VIARRDFLAGSLVALTASGAARGATRPGVIDTHVHLFGPHARYPLVPDRPYTPPEASLSELAAFNRLHGIARSVIVQPSFYGTDNRLLTDALAAMGNAARGVAVVAPEVSDAEVAGLRAAGVRGVRLNLETGGERDPGIAQRRFDELAARLTGTGLHLQLFAHLSVLDAIGTRLIASPVPLVVDHFGFPSPGTPAHDPAFQRLVALAGSGKAHVKLSAPWRMGGAAPGFEALKPLATALADAAPERLLWGTDWPHTQRWPTPEPARVVPFARPDVAAWKLAVARWLGADRWARAAWANPAALYGFNDEKKETQGRRSWQEHRSG